MNFWCVFALVCVLGVVVDGARPQLLESSAWYTNSTLLNVNFESIVVQMDFDQPLYTNGHSFLCPGGENSCPELTCKPCNWSGQQPTGCDDPTCCGPAQNGDMDLAETWCSSESPEYETLTVGETSRQYTLAKGERMFVRFFIPETDYCKSILVIPRPFFGSVSSSFSTLDAFPSFSTSSGWRNGGNERSFRFGQSSTMLCPNRAIHPEYNAGTYSGMIYAVLNTSFEIEILVSPEPNPLPFDQDRISCDDVPADVMNASVATQPSYCIEDGNTRVFRPDDAEENSSQELTLGLVVPMTSGCKTVTLSWASEIPTSSVFSNVAVCLALKTDEPVSANRGIFRLGTNGQTMSFTGCFENTTYLHCSIRFVRFEDIHVSFSTTAPIVRKLVTGIPDASISYMDGLQSGILIPFGGRKRASCVDFFNICYDWMLTPSDDPVFLFPPPASPVLSTEQTFEDTQAFYRNNGFQEIKENRLSFVFNLQIGDNLAVTKNLEELSVVVTSITNENGEPVQLPGGGFDSNPESEKQYSFSNFIPHIPLLEIPEFDPPRCDRGKFDEFQAVVLQRLRNLSTDTTFDLILAEKYNLDAMNAAVLGQSCTDQVNDNLVTFEQDTHLEETTGCVQPYASPEFFLDPCCNFFLNFLDCCLPFSANITEFPFEEKADVSGCGEQECAQSYYEELSFSLNHLQDVDLGCTNGLDDPRSSLGQAITESIQTHYTNCLVEVGLGDFYEGIDCQIAGDCEDFEGVCYEGKCVLGSLEEVERQFLECYVRMMPSSLESYIKRVVLDPEVGNADKSSPEFLEALLEAATVQDCVNPRNPLAISHRTRYQSKPLDYACVTESLYGLEWPQDFEEVEERCPGVPCLRSFGCLINSTSCIYEQCKEYNQEYIVSTENDCPFQDECDTSVDEDCEGSHCVYCPPNGDLPCLEVPNFGNEGDCESGVACELLDGTVSFEFSEDECRQQQQSCTTDCAGESCESISLLPGACFLPSVSSSSSCSSFSTTTGLETMWFKDGVCVVVGVDNDGCEELDPPSEFGSTVWETCQQNELNDCNDNTLEKQYLGCYVSLWHECENQDECENSGRCTDRDYFSIVHSHDPVEVQYGACISAGEYFPGTTPFCNADTSSSSVVGCIHQTRTQEECDARRGFFEPFWWADVSLTQEQCENRPLGFGNRGCQLYVDPLNILLWIFDEEKCDCRGGEVENAFKWVPGVWRGGIPRQLEWKRAERQDFYEFKPSLSFIMLSDWIQTSTEEQFVYPLQSQIICEYNAIYTTTTALVCDCLDDGGEICYDPGEQEKEVLMALSEACEGETAFVKHPSAQVNFGENSISESCSFLNLSIIYQNWFAAPFVPPPLSFKWQEPRDKGVVTNSNGATVGNLLGDGAVLYFSNPSVVEKIDVCLRISSSSSSSSSSKFPVEDFGYTTSKLERIFPLGVDVEIEDRGEVGIWFCSNFDFENSPTADQGVIRLFPIERIENYEEEDDEYTSDSTRNLCYILGAFYCFLGAVCLISLILSIQNAIQIGKLSLNLPIFCCTCFLVLCVFRASFMFLYPTGTFEFEPLAYFVVFEIPTFILFSVLIFMIYSFKRLVYKKGFFPGNPTPILIIGWSFVWSMWVIVTIVYSEVILEGDQGSSPCEGRVAVSYEDAETDTRTLSIAYQSVIIAVTLFLTGIFFYYTYLIFQTAKNKASKTKQFVIVVGGSFNVSFFVRSILFLIILAADFASSIYLFCTLLFTEILMMTFLLIQFNVRYVRALTSSGSSSTSTTKSTLGSSRMAHNYEM